MKTPNINVPTIKDHPTNNNLRERASLGAAARLGEVQSGSTAPNNTIDTTACDAL